MFRATTFVIVLALAGAPAGSLACDLWCTSAAAQEHRRNFSCRKGWFVMTMFSIRISAVGVLAVIALAGAAAAQTTSPILNTLEVRTLVASAEPADHARLSNHFSALADRHDAESRRHTAMATSFVGNPNRSLGTGLSAHCKRLATLNAESAATLRELVTHHQALASGAPSTAPRGAAPFHGGAGAPEPTAAELKALAARAATPADHRALEEYFLTLAKRYTAEATDHASIAQSYRGTRIAQAAVHCDRIVANAREAAKEATAAAEMHSALARIAR